MNRFTLRKAKDFPTEEIHFFAGNNGKVVGRVASGKIALISVEYKGIWVKNGEDWLCRIIKEDEGKVIVYPIELTRTADDNYAISLTKIGKLKTEGFKKEFYKPENSNHFLCTN